MATNYKIEGIYDQRTLKLLKAKGIRDFGFNFSPKSFNFIQEHIFLLELVPLLDLSDKLHLHFSRSNDPMIQKVVLDLAKIGIQKERIFLHCDEWSEKPESLGVSYYINYFKDLKATDCSNIHFQGIVFEFSFFEELHHRGVLNNFITNFYTHFSKVLDEDKKMILKIDWGHNVFPSLLDYFDFDLMSFSINSSIEICYRNVDLKKLGNEMTLIEKNILSSDRF